MKKEIVVNCPICGKVIGKTYRRFSNSYVFSCWECKRVIIYHPDDDTKEIRKTDKRSSVSGMRYC